MPLFTPINEFIKKAEDACENISDDRLKQLDHIASEIKNFETLPLVFICTHNSRRSHYAQIWAEVASSYYNLPRIKSYSGGTEVTALNERVVNSLKAVGFLIEGQQVDNPRYLLKYSDDHPPITAFSKKYDHFINPQLDFVALMTCSDADEKCPYVSGAKKRFLLKYEDPKISDDTPEESEVYYDRSLQIASEMMYLFRIIGHQ